MGNFDYYVHIMLIGASTQNVELACDDKEFSPKRRIYLIHSPNQKKSSDVKNPIALETIAKKTKKWIEKSSPRTKVILRKLTKNGAFDNLETITEIKKIVSEEKKRSDHISTKQIAINVTGGTNMMAGGATLAAFYNKTEAYYVKDTRYIQNQELPSLISKIGVSELEDNSELNSTQKNILYTIKNNTFDWSEPKPGMRNDPGKGYAIKYRIDAIQDTKWITEQHLSSTIKQKDLQAVFPKISPTKFSRNLKDLERRGMIRIETGIPTLTNEKRQTRYHYRDYVINEKEKLIIITDRGLSEIHTYTP